VTIVADFGDKKNGDCRRKLRLSPNSATVAVLSPFSATVAVFATVALFCDSVDRALQVCECGKVVIATERKNVIDWYFPASFVIQLFLLRRDVHGSTFLDPTWPNPISNRPNPTRPNRRQFFCSLFQNVDFMFSSVCTLKFTRICGIIANITDTLSFVHAVTRGLASHPHQTSSTASTLSTVAIWCQWDPMLWTTIIVLLDPTQPNPTHGWTRPVYSSALATRLSQRVYHWTETCKAYSSYYFTVIRQSQQ